MRFDDEGGPTPYLIFSAFLEGDPFFDGDVEFDFEVDFNEDTITATFANRNLNAGDIIRLHTEIGGRSGFPDLIADGVTVYFSDGYEVEFGYDAISADLQEDFVTSRFRGAVPETGDINTVLPSPIVTGTLSGPFDFADPSVVPEPGSLALVLTAFVALAATTPRRRGPTTARSTK